MPCFINSISQKSACVNVFLLLLEIILYIHGMVETNPSFVIPANVLTETFNQAVNKIKAMALMEGREFNRQAIYCQLIELGVTAFWNGAEVSIETISEYQDKIKQARYESDK
jgi:hypothetical protein